MKNRRDRKKGRPKGPARQSGATSAQSAGGGGRYWLYGLHPVRAALSNPSRDCLRLLATHNAADAVQGLADAKGLAPEEADRDMLDRLCGPDAVHQGIALEVVPQEPLSLGDLEDPVAGRPLLVLDQVTDPRNVGAILRSAAIFGACAVAIQDRNAPPESAALAKAAAGALESVPLVRVGNLARALDELKDQGYWVAGLAGEAEETLSALPLDRPLALILGSEGDGMRRLTREHCDQLVRIAMAPNAVGSLNVSNAAAVTLFAATQSATT
ncbi:MAG: 23S rRNA (guanosine(2251)-2'-O)-methyltransferase RlmB [Alphaproteobacteria bacterium]